MVINLYRSPQTFLTNINKDGRIEIPKTIMALMKNRNANLTGYVVDVTLEPFWQNPEGI